MDGALRTSYSQFGEDITARNLLRRVKQGFYVDVGAHHPFRHSNTAVFHIMGWNGVTVEPVQDRVDEFNRLRPHATNLRAAIHNTEDTVTLHKFRKGLANTIVEERVEGLSQDHTPDGEEVVPALSLNDLFDRHVPAGTRVNYLSIDIEGYDTEAVLAFDLGRHQPDVVCVEIHRPNLLALGTDPIMAHMSAHGYQLFAINIFSFTFVNIRSAADHLGIPRVARLYEASHPDKA